MSVDHRTLIEKLVGILDRNDWGALDQAFKPNAVLEYRQSGEVFRGTANQRAVFENYPGGLSEGRIDGVDVVGEGPQYAISPMYTMVAVEGSGDRGTGTFKSTYPDGSVWWVIVMYRAPRATASRTRPPSLRRHSEAPEWRAPYRDQADEAPRGS